MSDKPGKSGLIIEPPRPLTRTEAADRSACACKPCSMDRSGATYRAIADHMQVSPDFVAYTVRRHRQISRARAEDRRLASWKENISR